MNCEDQRTTDYLIKKFQKMPKSYGISIKNELIKRLENGIELTETQLNILLDIGDDDIFSRLEKRYMVDICLYPTLKTKYLKLTL
jgi:hypothetical protein